MIRYAEQLIREEHQVIPSTEYRFWCGVADHLNWAANIPEMMPGLPGGWQLFNHAKDIALGYIQLSKKNNEAKAAKQAAFDELRNRVERGYLT
jgi:hypothetical protein